MTYLEHITTYVISRVGKGLSLSSQDAQFVRQWEAAGIPAQAVCRAIRRQIERGRDRAAPFSLAACAKPIERAAAASTKAVDASSPAAQTSPWTTSVLLAQLTKAGQTTEDDPLRDAYRQLYRTLRAMPERALSLSEVARLDALTLAHLEKRVDAVERRQARRRARQQAKRLLGAGASAAATGWLADSLLARHYGQTHGLLLPSDLLLEDRPS